MSAKKDYGEKRKWTVKDLYGMSKFKKVGGRDREREEKDNRKGKRKGGGRGQEEGKKGKEDRMEAGFIAQPLQIMSQ